MELQKLIDKWEDEANELLVYSQDESEPKEWRLISKATGDTLFEVIRDLENLIGTTAI